MGHEQVYIWSPQVYIWSPPPLASTLVFHRTPYHGYVTALSTPDRHSTRLLLPQSDILPLLHHPGSTFYPLIQPRIDILPPFFDPGSALYRPSTTPDQHSTSLTPSRIDILLLLHHTRSTFYPVLYHPDIPAKQYHSHHTNHVQIPMSRRDLTARHERLHLCKTFLTTDLSN